MNRLLWLLLPMLALISACAGTVTVFPVEKGVIPVIDSSSQGFLIGSSKYSGIYEGDGKRWAMATSIGEGFRCKSYTLLYRGTDPATEKAVGDMSAIPSITGFNSTSDAPHDYEVEQGLGFVYATILPAGNYELWYRGFYCGNTQYYDHDFRVPFKVVAGKANYAGEVSYIHQFGENILGTITFSNALVAVGEEVDRDIPLLYRKYPFLEQYPVEKVELRWEQMYTDPKGASY